MKEWVKAAALTTLFSTGAVAQPMVYGLGTQGCGKYVAATDQSRRGDSQAIYQYITWMSGFISHASAVDGTEYFKNSDTDSIALWLERYCRAHPLEPFSTAVVHLMLELTKKQ
ncbi:hypothetical protein [Pseudomonas sp. NPDC090201]|uniref:hypothetical protein n=1 Tax=Pseudomonas sp. NPDC090201 TaxID=3364475 RepID=UPI0038045CE6